jgi:hypothetical protein
MPLNATAACIPATPPPSIITFLFVYPSPLKLLSI